MRRISRSAASDSAIDHVECRASDRCLLNLGELLDRLSLPGRNLDRVQFAFDRNPCNRRMALDRLKRNLGFERGRKSSPRAALLAPAARSQPVE
jgi:hypothetical protein